MTPAALLLGLTALTAAAERRYALVIGANEGDRDELPLRYAERDAERTADVLRDFAGVQPEDLVLLESPDAATVTRVLASLSHRAAADDAGLLFVYYSGHADAGSLHLGGTRLPLDQLTDQLRDTPADVKVLVVDACRAGELTRRKGAAPAEPFELDVQDRIDSQGLAIITSAAAGEDAQESEHLRGGVFTHHFLVGLQGAADTSGDRMVTLSESYRYGFHQTILTTSRAPVLQHPSYAYELSGRDDLVLTRLESPDAAASVVLEDEGQYIIFDDSFRDAEVVAELDVRQETRLYLQPGPYRVRWRVPHEVRETAVTLDVGEERFLSGADMAELPIGQTVRRGDLAQRRSALGFMLGGGFTAPWTPDTGTAPVGAAGFRLDLEPISVQARARGSQSTSNNAVLSMDQRVLGADLTLLRMLDVGRISPGIGLRGGADRVWQTFDTRGEAPDRVATLGRVSPVARVEVAVAARWVVGLEGGLSVLFAPSTGSTETTVAPELSLDLLTYAF